MHQPPVSHLPGVEPMPTLPIVLRWNGVDEAGLAATVPNRAGNISATFTVP